MIGARQNCKTNLVKLSGFCNLAFEEFSRKRMLVRGEGKQHVAGHAVTGSDVT
jgi:hypothetical protein